MVELWKLKRLGAVPGCLALPALGQLGAKDAREALRVFALGFAKAMCTQAGLRAADDRALP